MLKYKAGLPLSPLSQKIGYETIERSKTEQWRSIELIKKTKNILDVSNSYLSSFDSQPDKTLLHFRDYYLHKAIDISLYNTQFTNSNNSELTEKAKVVWSTRTFDSMWPYAPPDITALVIPEKYWGELGSIAFYFKYVSQATSLAEALENVLKFIWTLTGSSYNKLPDSRLNEILAAAGLTLDTISSISSYVPSIFSLTPSDEFYYLLVNSRRFCITEKSYSNLLLRLLLHEYHPELFNCLIPLLPKYLQKPLTSFSSSLFSLLPPSGFNLLFHCLSCEAYLRVSLYISSLPESIFSLPLTQLKQSDKYLEVSTTISSYLSLAYDSFSILNIFNTRIDLQPILQEIELDIVSWLSFTNFSNQSLDYRLTSFI